jgi:hypothetical protein
MTASQRQIKNIQNFQLQDNEAQWLTVTKDSSMTVLWNDRNCERTADRLYLWNSQTNVSVSLIDSGNSILKSFLLMLIGPYWNHMYDILILFFWTPNFPSFSYQKNIYKIIFQLKYFPASNLNMTLPEVTKWCPSS